MPQLSKANLMLMFICTWHAFTSLQLQQKNFTAPAHSITTYNPPSWHWPYT